MACPPRVVVLAQPTSRSGCFFPTPSATKHCIAVPFGNSEQDRYQLQRLPPRSIKRRHSIRNAARPTRPTARDEANESPLRVACSFANAVSEVPYTGSPGGSTHTPGLLRLVRQQTSAFLSHCPERPTTVRLSLCTRPSTSAFQYMREPQKANGLPVAKRLDRPTTYGTRSLSSFQDIRTLQTQAHVSTRGQDRIVGTSLALDTVRQQDGRRRSFGDCERLLAKTTEDGF